MGELYYHYMYLLPNPCISSLLPQKSSIWKIEDLVGGFKHRRLSSHIDLTHPPTKSEICAPYTELFHHFIPVKMIATSRENGRGQPGQALYLQGEVSQL